MPRKNRRKPAKKRDPREDWEEMDKSLTPIDVKIISDAVKGEQARNAKAAGVYYAIKSPKIA